MHRFNRAMISGHPVRTYCEQPVIPPILPSTVFRPNPTNLMHALSVSAMTATCAAGTGLTAIRESMRTQASGLRSNDFPDCDLDTWIGRVDSLDEVRLPSALDSYECRNNRLALLGLEQDDLTSRVAALRRRFGAERIACVMGTSTAGIEQTEQAYRNMEEAERFQAHQRQAHVHNPHTTTQFVARVLGLEGPVLTISTACSSSAKVFASAARMIAAGLTDAAIVGGVDSLCLSVLYGFHSLELVSDQPCRPFDRNRNGLSLGEAAGFALLERDPNNSIGRLLGWGESSDAWHMAAPHPEGAGAKAAMAAALSSAGLEPGAVDHINCHGTATPMNDRIETQAIRQMFDNPPSAVSTKGWTGHTLGAAGIIESVFSLLAIADQQLPASLNCDNPDPECADFIVREARPAEIQVVMSNSFGFGGSNCSLLFGAP